MDIYQNFPEITYDGKLSKNIILKISMVRDLVKKYSVFYPYLVKDGERPDTIASDYYGNSDYEWLVLIANDIYDVRSEWVKSYAEFYQYMLDTYGNINQTKQQIVHYKYTGIGNESAGDIARKSYKMSTKTYSLLSPTDKSGWTPVYLYDYELELNESRRSIVLLSNQYLKQINREVRDLF